MRKLFVFLLFFSFSLNTFSQKNYHHNSFYVSVDALSILNSVIQSELKTFNVSGEVCINHSYGLIINAAIEKEHIQNYSHDEIQFIPEFRWYFAGEECSAFHLGGYLNFGAGRIIKDERYVSNTYLKYEESFFGGGLSAGYKVLIKDRWTINPACFVGYEKRYKTKVEEAVNAYPQKKESIGEVRVVLGVGYRIK